MNSPGSPDAQDEARSFMKAPAPKSTTKRIVISEPDEEQLQQHLDGRAVSPGLGRFLRNMINGRKWARKINIPSAHDNLAAVLVFTSELKERGLEISSELHVFFEDRTFVEKWQVLGESEQTSSVSTNMFRSVEIDKVRLENGRVSVALQLVGDGVEKTATRIFDFNVENPGVRMVSNPFA